jgi:hypothetical protein
MLSQYLTVSFMPISLLDGSLFRNNGHIKKVTWVYKEYMRFPLNSIVLLLIFLKMLNETLWAGKSLFGS